MNGSLFLDDIASGEGGQHCIRLHLARLQPLEFDVCAGLIQDEVPLAWRNPEFTGVSCLQTLAPGF